MTKLIDADALIDAIKKYANEPVKQNDRRWNTRCTAIIMDMIGMVKKQSNIDAIPVEWLREKMNTADDAGDLDSVDLISWLIQTWQKEQEAR